MTERLMQRVHKIAGKVKNILSGSTNRSIIHFNPPDPVLEMYRVADEEIQKNVEQKRMALEVKKRVINEEAIKHTLAASATKKLELRSTQATRREIIQKINRAKQGGGAFDPKYKDVIASWKDQLHKAEEIIERLSQKS